MKKQCYNCKNRDICVVRSLAYDLSKKMVFVPEGDGFFDHINGIAEFCGRYEEETDEQS